jgi:hypothetical protein
MLWAGVSPAKRPSTIPVSSHVSMQLASPIPQFLKNINEYVKNINEYVNYALRVLEQSRPSDLS